VDPGSALRLSALSACENNLLFITAGKLHFSFESNKKHHTIVPLIAYTIRLSLFPELHTAELGLEIDVFVRQLLGELQQFRLLKPREIQEAYSCVCVFRKIRILLFIDADPESGYGARISEGAQKSIPSLAGPVRQPYLT
jgi:hypothetical protein